MEKDGVEEFLNFLEGYLVGDCLGVLGKYDWGKGGKQTVACPNFPPKFSLPQKPLPQH
jgi:hypothetical protein